MTATQSRHLTAMAPNIYDDITLPQRTFLKIEGTHLRVAVARGQMTPLHAVVLTDSAEGGSMADYLNVGDHLDFSRTRRAAENILRMGASYNNATMVMFEHGNQILSWRRLPPELHLFPTLHPGIFKEKFLELLPKSRKKLFPIRPDLHWMWDTVRDTQYQFVQIGNEAWGYVFGQNGEDDRYESDYALRQMIYDCVRATGEATSEDKYPPRQNDVTELTVAELLRARAEKVKAEQNVRGLKSQRIDIAKQLSAAQTRLATAATRLHQLEGR